MKRRSLTAVLTAAVLLAAGTCVAAGRVQPSAGSQPPTTGGGGAGQQQQPLDAKALRKIIDARLEDHRQGIKRLEEAMKKLEEGGDPSTISHDLLDQFRDARRGPGNRADRPGGGGNPADGNPRPNTGAGGGGAGGAGGGGERRNSEYDLTGPKLSPEEHDKVRELLDQKHPELLKKVIALGAGNKELTERLIDGVGGRARWLEQMRDKDKPEFDLRVSDLSTGLDVLQSGRAVTDAKKKGDANAENAARAQLHSVMEARFETRQQLSRLQLERLIKKADDLKQTLANNDKNRDSVIEKRTDEFLKLMENRDKKGEPEAQHKP